jgi:L-gulonate 5-dehydrogenase
MKAVRYNKSEKALVIDDIEEPKALPGEVIIRVAAVGICGSDLELFSHDVLADNYIMGHEVSGVISKLGDGVSRFAPGDRVAPRPVGCGTCASCRRGDMHLCSAKISIGTGTRPGGYAEYVSVPEAMLTKIPDDMGLRAAALTDTFAVPAHGIGRVGVSPGEDAVILGMGPIGISLLMMLKDIDVKKVLVIDLNEKRLQFSRSFGADETVSPNTEGYTEKVIQFFSGTGPDVVFDCTGNPRAFTDALALVRPGGRVCLLGISFEQYSMNPLLISMREINIVPSYASLPKDNDRALNFIHRNGSLAEKQITEIISIDQVPSTFEKLCRGEAIGKAVIEFFTE